MKMILYLVDGTSICYRSFYALSLSTRQGFPTGAIYGFVNTLKRIMKKFDPSYLGICFDVSRKTFRQAKFKEYKIQRPPTPDKLKMQIPLIKKIINCLGIEIIEKEGWEADDLIASLVRKAQKEDVKVIIVGSDKDVFQLIHSDKVIVYEPFKDRFYDEKSFREEFGFLPSQFVDYLSLVGDAVDNIPGAKGIGKIQALNLIKNYGSIEKIYENLKNLPPSLREILKENKENVFLSKELIKLDEVDLAISWEKLKIKEPDYLSLYRIFKDLEFKSFLKELSLPSLKIDIEIKEGISLDIKEKIRKDKLCFLYIDREEVYVWRDVIYKVSLQNIRDILEDKEVQKVSYDFKRIFKENRICLNGHIFDIMIAAYLVNPSLSSYTLIELVNNFLNIFSQEIAVSLYPYFIYKLYHLLKKKLEEYQLEDFFCKIEMPLVKVLAEMEKNGVKIDIEFLKEFSQRITREIFKISKKIFEITGRTFNLNSPKQLSKILFEELKIPPVKKGKTGFSTDEETLLKLSDRYPVAQLIMEYRQLNKLKNTYIDNFFKEIKNNRIFTYFSQTGSQTGRIISVSPNLQNLPVQHPLAREIRKMVISSFEDGFILSGDYSQIELRILAHLSEDENLIKAFREDMDIHKFTASLLFGISLDKVNSSQRELAKKINFGIIYGMGEKRLAKEAGISFEEARKFIKEYFSRYPGIKKYIEETIKQAEEKGFVRTLGGRIRFLEKHSFDPSLFERQAVNTPIQGSAADLIKIAMVRIYEELLRKNLSSKMILQIHDELVFDVKKEEIEIVKVIVKKEMENAFRLKVPLKVDLKIGKNWLEVS